MLPRARWTGTLFVSTIILYVVLVGIAIAVLVSAAWWFAGVLVDIGSSSE